MNNNIKEIRKILITEFLFFIFASIIIVVLYENNIILSGTWADDKNSEFLVLTTMELLTLLLIPLSLKLMKTKYVRKSIACRPHTNQLKWSILRLFLVGMPMTINVLLYYFYMNVAFGYMAIIGLISMFFIYPGKGRCTNESAEEI